MDETGKGVQDPSQVTGPASSPGAGSTPEPETPTLTEAQAKAQVTKAVSDALATAGRTAKKFEQREAATKAQEEALTARQAELDARQQKLDDAELEAIKGDPDLEAQYRRKQGLAIKEKALAEDKRKFEQEKTQHQADIDAANATKKEIAIWEIAAKYGADPVALKELNLDTPEQIEAVAKAMSAGKAKEPGTGEPDSGKTKGGLIGIDALAKANEDFVAGRITEKQLREVRDQNK